MTNADEEKSYKFFAKTFHELMVPVLDDMKQEISRMKESMATKEDIERLGRKIELGTDCMECYGEILGNHKKRILAPETN